MNNVVALNKIKGAENSIFSIDEQKHECVIENAVIFYQNFSGRENQFGNSQRKFCVAVPEEMAKNLLANGWQVKAMDLKDAAGTLINTLYYIQVKLFYYEEEKLNANKYLSNPDICLYLIQDGDKKTVTSLDESTVGMLDNLPFDPGMTTTTTDPASPMIFEYTFVRADMTIHFYTPKKFDHICSYVKDLRIQEKLNHIKKYDGAYDGWENN